MTGRQQVNQPPILTAATAVALALYVAVSLWPFDWQPRGWAVNGAEPLRDGVARFPEPGIALADGSPSWIEPAIRSHRLELALSVRSLLPEQFGPARILTLSLDSYKRNLLIGQEGADLILRLRTPWTNPNGTIDGEPVVRVPRVFITGDLVDIHILIEPRSLRVTLGDELIANQSLPSRPLETWDPSHRLALGNELTGTRPWLGEIRRAVARAGTSVDHSTVNYAETNDLAFPSRFLITGPPPKLVPLVELNHKDALRNIVFYVPLGFLLGLLVDIGRGGQRWWLAFAALSFVGAMSASMEVLQYLFVPRRWPSVDDVIFNTLGGGLGLLLALCAARRLAPAVKR